MQRRCAPANLVTTAQLLGRLSTTTTTQRKSQKCKSLSNFRTLLAATIAIRAIAFSMQAANLSDKDKQFLAGYEKVQAALAADEHHHEYEH